MSEIKRVKIDSILESQIPEFLNEDSPLFVEFLKQYYRSLEHQGGTLDIINNLKKYKDIQSFNPELLIPNTTLTSQILSFDTTINVDSTEGWPDSYGLLKIDDEIITYLSKTTTSFVDCKRGFSGIDQISSTENPEYLNFSTTSANEHPNQSIVTNLSNLFLVEFYQKFRNEFFPGFENREFGSQLELPNILTSAKNFYSSKGTDSSYKLLFKILFNTDIEIIKPQDTTLVPSSNVYFVTKNILVEKISGLGDPLELPGNFLFQTLSGIGTVSASIFNVEYRPVDKKELYEISLDSTSFSGTFQVSGTTRISEDVEIGSDTILVDSTNGFSQQGSFVVRTETSDLIHIFYTDKTTTQFLGVTGVDRFLPFNTEIIEEKFANSFVGSGTTSPINFRVINVIDTIDSSKTFNMRVGDIIKLAGFGKDLSRKVEFNNWIYNTPTYHNIRSIDKVSTILYRITLYDEVYFYLNENILLFDENNNVLPASIISIEYSSPTIKKYSNVILVQLDASSYNVNKAVAIRRKINKANHNINYFPNINKIPTGVQNTYTNTNESLMYVTSTGLPNYTISATDNKSIVTTSGIGKTDVFYCPNHPYVTGETIYYQPYQNSGISTGPYQLTKISNDTFKLSFSKSDVFSKTYIQANSNILSDEIVKFGYQNKTIKNQKLIKEINLIPTPLSIFDDENARISTGDNKQLGLLSNGVELYSPTIFDETIHFGKITSIEVIDSGSGYDVLSPPDVEITDISGFGAKAKLNIIGNVKQVDIISPGVGYQNKPKITISGGNGSGCVLDSNLVSAKITSSFKGDSGVSIASNTITFDEQVLFEDNEEVTYNSNGNTDIGGITNGAIYYVGITTDSVIKLYTNIQDSSSKINPINISSISFGIHNLTTVKNKNTISKIYVKNSGEGYSNRSVTIPSILAVNNVTGINTFDSYIFAKNHGFNSGEIVKYSYTETPISGLSSQISYYVDVINRDKFKLSSAGIGATLGNINLINKRYERLNTLGVGTHIIQYPPIEITVESVSSIGSTTIIKPILKAVILGSVDDVFLENGGVSYGCTNIINFHRRPLATLPEVLSEALLKPIIVNSSIVGIQIINKGRGYRPDATINIESSGKFAEFLPTIENGSVVSVTVVSGGVGYAVTNTKLTLQNRGSGLKLLANVNEWKINQVVKLKNVITGDDGIIHPSKNSDLGLQFVNLYIPRSLRVQLGDNIGQNFTELSSGGIHSPLLGYAYDGNPIYGPYAYQDPLGGQIERMKSGYVLNVNPNLELRPPGFESGYFIDDYEFIGTGDLDKFNGRFCVTPEFPDGIYAYFYTIVISTSGGSQNVSSGIAIPSYPYVIGPKFKDVPIENNFLPKFNQDLYKFDTSVTRNISPYYLNYYNSGYELINSISDDYKQEFRVERVTSGKIEKTTIFSPGDNYSVGDVVLLDNENTEGSSASISVSRVSGKTISDFEFINKLTTNVDFIIKSNKIIAKTSGPHELIDGQPIKISGISTITSSKLEGIRYVKVNQKEVELAVNIDAVGVTGASTKIVVRDVNGFEPNDFIGIGSEILHITKISKEESSFSVNRISNTGVHTVGIDNVFLLPTKFEFSVGGKLFDYVIGNTTIFFNPKEDVGTGIAGTTRVISGLYTSFTRTIPSRSIYFSEGHKFFTGEELIYNCGFGGTSLFVNNIGSGVSFKLENNQKVYAVNLGNNYLGLSTVGFTSTSGIGSQFNSLEFRNLDEFFGVIGVAHSLTTTNSKIIGNQEDISIQITTATDHGLASGDPIKLNVDISEEEIVKLAYDPVNRKLLAKEISFTNNDVSSANDTINISNYDGEVKTGDKVVYIAGTPISGLSHYGIYYVIKDSLNKIKLAEYLSDIFPITSFGTNNQGIPILGAPNFPIKHINFNSTGGGTQKIYLINPPLTIFRGNKLKFDLSDLSLLNMNLKFYAESLLEKSIEIIGKSSTGFAITENGVPGTPGAYVTIDTGIEDTPSTFYYNIVSNNLSELDKVQISPDYTVIGNNHVELLNHSLNGNYKVKVKNNKIFTIENNKNLTYIESQSIVNAVKTYDTDSKTALGPISKLKIDFAGRGYKKPPLVKGIQSQLGKNAVIKLDSTDIGRIESFTKIKDGFDYPTDPTLSPQMSAPSVVGIKNILTIQDVSVIFGGNGYNNPPTLIVPENRDIKLETQTFNGSAGSIESVKILKNSREMSNPLEILTIKNSNGYDIDFITVSNQLVTLELSNQSFIPTSFGASQSIFPFAIGDSIFIENCRLTPSTRGLANFNSSSYGFQFFPVVAISTSNNTITYSMAGISTGSLGTYNDLLNLGIVVNKKDMPIFQMNLTENVNYFSSEVVNTNKFEATVMENGWDSKLNQLRLTSGVGELEVESKLFGQESKVNGTIENFTTFILNSTLGVSRDKVGNIDNSVGILNEFQQRISDNFYYQKFSYAIKGDIPYDKWKESVRSLVHPSGFKEFSDLVIYSEPQQTSYSKNNLKPILLDSSAQINVNIDNEISMYDRTNFTQVYEEDSLDDGSVEKIYVNDGLSLKPYINNITNKVLKIDDISDQFNGRSFQILDNRYSGASNLLLYNRNFIQEEVVGFITATYPGILANVDWNRTIASEKIGLVVDAVAHDLKYESNNKSIEVGLSYWSGVGTSYVAGEEVETISGLKYISQLSKYIINNVGVPTSYNLSTSFPQQFDSTLEKDTSCNVNYNENCYAEQQSAISNLVGIVTSIVGIGTTSVPSEIILPSLTRGGSIVGLSTFKLKNKGISLFKHVFQSNSSSIDIINNKFIIPNHNYQSGQKLIYEYDSSPIGIATTSYVSGITSSLIQVGNFKGTAIFENGYSIAISTSITGISTTLIPAGPNFRQYSSVLGIGTLGINAEFNVFLTYNVVTGVPIGTSIILNKGGRGYKIGDTVTIAGTSLGGTSPTNNLTFVVSAVAPTDVLAQSNVLYTDVPSSDGKSTFNVLRDLDGFISDVNVVNGGVGYSSTSIVSIAGTYIGGTLNDIISFSPIELGTKVLPRELYVSKLNDNEFRVAGLSTSFFVDLVGIGSGSHSLTYSNPDPSVLISIDGIVQSALRRKSLQITLSGPISTATTTILSVSSGISSLRVNDIININNELILIKTIGVSSTNSIEVSRGYFDSISGIHTVGAACSVLSGDFKIIGDTIYFTTPPYGKIGLVGIETGSTFGGRVFSRRLNPSQLIDQNIILDDISLSFTGLAATQFNLKSNGEPVQAIFNDINDSSNINNNPLILINNVLQQSGQKYEIEDENENQINFIDGVPKAGKIVKVGITTGFGYQPLLVAAARVTVSSSGTISSVILTGSGGGYRQPPVISVASTIGSGASITATVGSSGTITNFTIVNPGSGYTSTSLPIVVIGIPTGYSNIPLTYHSSSTGVGQGAKITVNVGAGSSIILFKFDETGVAYKVGDVLTATGITTGPIGPVQEFKLTVEEVETDTFSGFYPGQFVLFGDITDQFTGFKKRFTLKAIIEGLPQQISLRVPEGSDLDITNNIFIYLNDVLQVPGEAYTFVGSRIIFTEAPKPNSSCSIFYYRGSSIDVEEVVPPNTIKAGDRVIIKESPNDPFDIDQFDRVVKNISSSDEFDTFTYDSLGISTDPTKVRPLTWSKQKTDRIINGALFSKSRPNLKSSIRPQATIIKNLTIDDDEIYVDNAYPIFTDIDGLNENLRNIILLEDRQIEPAIAQCQVSTASSISNINIISSGTGYVNDVSPELLVSFSAITQKDPIFNWKKSVGISPSYKLNSVVFGNVFVGVGSTQAVISSPDGKTWQNSTIGLQTNFDSKSVITTKNNNEYVYVSVGSNARVVRSIGVGNSISSWSTISLKEERFTPGIGAVNTVNSNYSGTFNEVVYSPSYSTYVTVGTAGSIFTGIGIGTGAFISRFSQTLSTLNSVSFSYNSSINSGYFVAVGINGTILTSSSGQIWDIVQPITNQTLNKVIFAEGQFVIVGNSGTVIKSISQSQYELIPTNIGVNLVNIKYAYGTYVASDNSQNLYYSLDLSQWVLRSTNQSNIIKDFIFTDEIGVDGTYVIVGLGGTSVYAEPILNRATGIAGVSGGIVTSITVTNGGFGYSQSNPPEVIIKSDVYNTENILSIKVIGDHGKIIGINTFITGTPGIGTTTPKIEFVLKSETYDNQTLGIGYTSLNVLGVNNSQLTKGDYFVITDSNVTVGHAVTGITTSLGGMSNYPASKVGTAVSFIDGVYRVEQVTNPVLGIVTVTCNLAPSSFGNFVQIYKRGLNNSGIGTNNFYGNYSWGKIFDFQNRILGNPKSFSAFTDNGIVGLSTSSKVIRTRSLLSN